MPTNKKTNPKPIVKTPKLVKETAKRMRIDAEKNPYVLPYMKYPFQFINFDVDGLNARRVAFWSEREHA